VLITVQLTLTLAQYALIGAQLRARLFVCVMQAMHNTPHTRPLLSSQRTSLHTTTLFHLRHIYPFTIHFLSRSSIATVCEQRSDQRICSHPVGARTLL